MDCFPRKTSPLLRFWSIWLILLAACKPIENSKISDIYKTDAPSSPQGNKRRHPATSEEILWAVQLAGCSGVLLSSQYLMTANHCQTPVGLKVKSGFAVLTRSSSDLEVLSTMENSPSLDYKILKIRWLRPMPESQRFPPYIAIRAEDLYLAKNPGQGDDLFTVGFPDDRPDSWLATYSEGQAKAFQSPRLSFNVGIINGSSGGGILRKEDQMLVSLANGGSRSIYEQGWNAADENDPASWNFGPALWEIYAASPLLASLYPQGKRADLGELSPPRTQINLAIRRNLDKTFLELASNLMTQTLLLCPETDGPCLSTTPGVESLRAANDRNGRRFFLSALNPDYLNKLSVSALGVNGELIGQRRLSLERQAP